MNMDSVKVTVDVTCYPVNGDKFTTLHGQKGVVTIFKDEDMPVVNGMRAEIVIGTSSIIKRGTTSQLLEAAYCHYAVNMMASDCPVSLDRVVAHYIDSRRSRSSVTDILKLYDGDVRVQGRTIRRKEYKVRSNIHMTSNVTANYGIIRVMQSCFLSSFKMSTTADVAPSTRRIANRQSSTGGSKSLGEMEVTQLIASGLSHTLSELSDRSDTHIVEVCTQCKRLVGLCNCTGTERILQSIVLPLDTIKYIYASRVALDLDTLIA